MIKTLVLYSSARPDGNTFQFANTFNQHIPSEMCYLDSLQIAQYDYLYRNQEDDFTDVIDKMLRVDVIILASPVYWYSMTPAFRCFFDRFTDLTELSDLKSKGKKLRDKSFYLLATSANQQPPISFTFPVEKTFEYLGWPFMGTHHVNCKDGYDESQALASLQPLLTTLHESANSNAHEHKLIS